VQRLRPAVAVLEEERLPGEFSVSRLDKFGAQNDRWARGAKFNSRPVWKVLTQTARAMGHDFNYSNTEEVFDDIAFKFPVFTGMSYEAIGTNGLPAGMNKTIPA
jgi:predicted molibdopterin-dependent oxidoreductase YjgC